MKCGCVFTEPERLAKVPFLNEFLTLPLIADSTNYEMAMNEPWGMLGNDEVGNCVLASYAHDAQTKSVNARGVARKFTAAQVNAWYSAITGYDPNDPSTDNGTNPIDALKYLKKIGEIEAWGRVDVQNNAHVAAAIELFGGVWSAWNLPLAWQGKTKWTKGPTTSGEWRPGSWGGHMVNEIAYDPLVNTRIVTWGRVVDAENDARPYCREGYVLITREWMTTKGRSIQGFDLDGLRSRLALVD